MNKNLLMQLETEHGVGNADGGAGTAQVLLLQNWNLSCHRCISISEEEASAPASGITHHQDFPAIMNTSCRPFSTFPKINWKKLPKPAGADGQLSSE